jgi:hypothetical protein
MRRARAETCVVSSLTLRGADGEPTEGAARLREFSGIERNVS